MSVDNGKISPRMGKKLGANGDGDLQVVFGRGIMNHAWFFLSAPINKWARYKPFRHPNNVTFSDHYTGPNGEYIVSDRLTAAAAANYGLSAPNPVQNIVSTLGQVWTYNRCQSGDPMSAFDFECYNHNAEAPVGVTGDITIALSQTNSFDFGGYIDYTQSGTDVVSWPDLTGSIGNYYLCVVFSTGPNCTGTLIAKTSDRTLGNAGIVLEITNNELRTLQSSNYQYYYLVARSDALPGLVNPGANTASYLGLPAPTNTYDLAGRFTIISSSISQANLTLYSLVQNPAYAGAFHDASPYVGMEDIGSQYLPQPNAPYWLHLAFSITAGSSSFALISPKLALTQTFNSANGFYTPLNCTLYDSTFTQQTQVVIPAGSTQTVYLVASAPILGLYQNGTQGGQAPDQQFSMTVKLYSNDILIDETNMLRVKNFNY